MRLTTPRVSIITPVFRSELTLHRTLDSLMAQSERGWESIIVDDGSPDGSWKIAEGFAYFDPRFTLIRQANLGAGAARNLGLQNAHGEFVMFLDADDWLEPNALALLLAAADKAGADLVHGAFRYTTNDGWLTDWIGAYTGKRPLFEALCASNVLSMPAAVIARRSAVMEVGGFDPSLKNCGDWDLWGRLARSKGKIVRIDDCVANYRMRPASLSHNPNTLLGYAMQTMERLHAPDARVPTPTMQFAAGADPAELPGRQINFTLYTVGLSLAHNDVATAEKTLDTISDWPSFVPQEAAGFLFSGLCFARCQPPGGAGEFLPQVMDAIRQIVASLAERAGKPLIVPRMLEALQQLSGEPLPPPRSAPGQFPLAHSA
jgi:GT2 family glycosyltransferase